MVEVVEKAASLDQVNKLIYNNTLIMLQNIAEYKSKNNHDIVPADDPKYLKIGYICLLTNTEWLISIMNIKNDLSKMDSEFAKQITKCLSTSKGRKDLITLLRLPLEASFKLKAFL